MRVRWSIAWSTVSVTALACKLLRALSTVDVFAVEKKESEKNHPTSDTVCPSNKANPCLHRGAHIFVLLFGTRLNVQVERAETMETETAASAGCASVDRYLVVVGRCYVFFLFFPLNANIFPVKKCILVD